MSGLASGKYCITGGADRCVKLWNPYRVEPGEDEATGSPLLVQTFKGPHGHPVLDVCMCDVPGGFSSVMPPLPLPCCCTPRVACFPCTALMTT